jgi:hypothetical protein
MKRYRILLLSFVLLVTVLAIYGQRPDRSTYPPSSPELHYHDYLPEEPLRGTLNPGQFRENPTAFVAYALAARIEPTLYQVPCYCGCDKEQGHQSLLDCFTDNHGALCHICQKEVLFCFLQNQKHKNAAQIREAMARGAASKLDLKKLAAHFYSQLEKSPDGPGAHSSDSRQ